MILVPKTGDRVRVFFRDCSRLLPVHFEASRTWLDLGAARYQSTGRVQLCRHYPPLVILYKIHGCISDGERRTIASSFPTKTTSITWLKKRSTASLVPNDIQIQLGYGDFLFMGYSFHDWNVRGLVQAVRSQTVRNERFVSVDLAVLLKLHPYEDKFFENTGSRRRNGSGHLREEFAVPADEASPPPPFTPEFNPFRGLRTFQRKDREEFGRANALFSSKDAFCPPPVLYCCSPAQVSEIILS
jgi:hypothetical protein